MVERNELDEIKISGLSAMLDEEEVLPIVALKLQCQGRTYQASILTADGEWALSIREAGGQHLSHADALYPTQSDAIIAALLRVLESATDTL